MSAPSGAFDARHVFNANVIYELPFGPGKAFLNQAGVVARHVWIVVAQYDLHRPYRLPRGPHDERYWPGRKHQRAASQPGSRPAACIWPAGISTRRLFALPGLRTRYTLVAPAPQDSAMSPAISCEVPGPGKWIWRLPNAFLLQNSYNFSSGPKCSTFSTGRMYASPDGLISASDFGMIYLPLEYNSGGNGYAASNAVSAKSKVLKAS